jgi:hypothetical protein
MRKHYRRTIRASSPSEYRRKLNSAVQDVKREVVNDIRRQIQKALRKH